MIPPRSQRGFDSEKIGIFQLIPAPAVYHGINHDAK